MADIFVSYRRDDSQHAAGRLNDRLAAAFGDDRVFFDTVAIQPGEDFHEVLGAKIGACRVLVTVIGPRWLEILEGRLGESNDFVRIEIAEALRRGVRVVPVLIDGAKPPPEARLPDDLKLLSRRNALPVRADTFRPDADQLIAFLRQFLDGGVSTPHVASEAASAAARFQSEGRIRIAAPLIHGAPNNGDAGWFLPGNGRTEWFKDHPQAPEMVIMPAGSFTMGSPNDEPERIGKGGKHAALFGIEEPCRLVHFAQPFAAGRCAITVDQFAIFVQESGHTMPDEMLTYEDGKWKNRLDRSWHNPGFPQTGRHPVVGVSWDDSVAYVRWLSNLTGKLYRLLSEAEWEYAARAGATTPFWWGKTIAPTRANYDGNHTHMATMPVDHPGDQFQPNPWGLHQVHGNVWEWCQDVFHLSYDGAPTDGTPWLNDGDSGRRIARGGAWSDEPKDLRAALRIGVRNANRYSTFGLRVARTVQ